MSIIKYNIFILFTTLYPVPSNLLTICVRMPVKFCKTKPSDTTLILSEPGFASSSMVLPSGDRMKSYD
jgi:hypothetical protein